MYETTKLRNMTAIYILHQEKMLMLYRVGSRVVEPSWCGIGGHFEESELNDPKACVLRELEEETPIRRDMLEDLTFKYVTLRLKNGEIRQNYYYFASLKDDVTVADAEAATNADIAEGTKVPTEVGVIADAEAATNAGHTTDAGREWQSMLSSNEGSLRWVPLAEVMDKKMPLTAKYMLQHYLEIGRFDDKVYSGTTMANRMVFVELNEF